MNTEAFINEISALSAESSHIIIAIDGRCGSGKTTLAAELASALDATVFHMDDFFLRAEQRTEERLKTPGEFVDHERFLEEILKPICDKRSDSSRDLRYSQKPECSVEQVYSKDSRFSRELGCLNESGCSSNSADSPSDLTRVFLRRFSHHTFQPEEPEEVTVKPVVIVEGTYSLHPNLRNYYDLKIFTTTDKETQLERIAKRNPKMLDMFINKWIPLEELYFESLNPKEFADYTIET